MGLNSFGRPESFGFTHVNYHGFLSEKLVGCAALTVLKVMWVPFHGLRAFAKPRALHPWLSCRHAVGVRLRDDPDVERRREGFGGSGALLGFSWRMASGASERKRD